MANKQDLVRNKVVSEEGRKIFAELHLFHCAFDFDGLMTKDKWVIFYKVKEPLILNKNGVMHLVPLSN